MITQIHSAYLEHWITESQIAKTSPDYSYQVLNRECELAEYHFESETDSNTSLLFTVSPLKNEGKTKTLLKQQCVFFLQTRIYASKLLT